MGFPFPDEAGWREHDAWGEWGSSAAAGGERTPAEASGGENQQTQGVHMRVVTAHCQRKQGNDQLDTVWFGDNTV